MDKKILNIGLAVVLIGCFFLPYTTYTDSLTSQFGPVEIPRMSARMSGYDLVFSKGYDVIFFEVDLFEKKIIIPSKEKVKLGWEKYILLLIPLSGIFLLIGSLTGKYIGRKSLWVSIAILTIVYYLVRLLIEGFVGIGELYKVIGLGLYISLVACTGVRIYEAIAIAKAKAKT